MFVGAETVPQFRGLRILDCVMIMLRQRHRSSKQGEKQESVHMHLPMPGVLTPPDIERGKTASGGSFDATRPYGNSWAMDALKLGVPANGWPGAAKRRLTPFIHPIRSCRSSLARRV